MTRGEWAAAYRLRNWRIRHDPRSDHVAAVTWGVSLPTVKTIRRGLNGR